MQWHTCSVVKTCSHAVGEKYLIVINTNTNRKVFLYLKYLISSSSPYESRASTASTTLDRSLSSASPEGESEKDRPSLNWVPRKEHCESEGG